MLNDTSDTAWLEHAERLRQRVAHIVALFIRKTVEIVQRANEQHSVHLSARIFRHGRQISRCNCSAFDTPFCRLSWPVCCGFNPGCSPLLAKPKFAPEIVRIMRADQRAFIAEISQKDF